MPDSIRGQTLRMKYYDSHGRKVGYPVDSHGQEELFNWLRENPHRFHLGRIALLLTRGDGSPARPSDLSGIAQELDLWTGTLDCQFIFENRPVRVRTACAGNFDTLAVRIESPLIDAGQLAVLIAFPYASPGVNMADWKSPGKHQTTCSVAGQTAALTRQLDATQYHVALAWNDGPFAQVKEHEFVLKGGGGRLNFTASFSSDPAGPPPSADQVFQSSARHWQDFWTSGGAIDLSASTDARAEELERRIVLSQYNTAIHCAGPMPPPETGLLFNSWYGKSHLEMHWWHGVHFAAWGRIALLERSLDYYQRIRPKALQIARDQGYDGARWPKMVGPDGDQSPSPIAPLLIWQQPHPIYYAELCYRANPRQQTLDRWQSVVFDTADFLASFAALEGDRFVLGPPLKSVPENTETTSTRNPTFELNYWRFGLRTALLWRQRLGMPAEPSWTDVLNRLAALPVDDGRYLMMEGMTDTYTQWNWEHPSLLGAMGMQPGQGVDAETMRRSLKKIMDVWQWDRCWGWDFPMAAMTAARLGEPEIAVDALMIDSVKNRYLPNGHVYQRPSLTAYLPANGGLLAAISIMRFPANGKWSARREGLTGLL
jgi:protein-glucosylgalactosylhydroxylysine glucosidase